MLLVLARLAASRTTCCLCAAQLTKRRWLDRLRCACRSASSVTDGETWATSRAISTAHIGSFTQSNFSKYRRAIYQQMHMHRSKAQTAVFESEGCMSKFKV